LCTRHAAHADRYHTALNISTPNDHPWSLF
jgi:hypothetical protein